jgi:hypothetical protein
LVLLNWFNLCLYSSALNNAQKNGDNGNYQQHVNDSTQAKAIEAQESQKPDNDKDDSDSVQKITHDALKRLFHYLTRRGKKGL